MNHCSIFSGAAIVGLALILAPVTVFAQQKTLKEQIVGTWSNVFWEQTYPDGRKERYFGAHPKGISTFDSNGRFSVILLNPDLPQLASNDRVKPTPEEAVVIVKGALSYYGTYTVHESEKSLTLNITCTAGEELLERQQRASPVALKGMFAG